MTINAPAIALNPNDEEDVAASPGVNADSPDDIERHISVSIRQRYEVHSYRHAATILADSFPEELAQVEQALLSFSMTTREIALPGGNESEMPKKLARIQGDLQVRMQQFSEELLADGKLRKSKLTTSADRLIENFIDGHKIDFVKGRVALDMEWNSKD